MRLNKIRIICTLSLTIQSCFCICHAQDLYVNPGQSIQAAIDASVDGDTVILAPGNYTGDGNRDLDLLGKSITIQSADPNDPNIVETTVIDCQGTESDPHRGFYFHNGESETSILCGFKVTNGYATTSIPGSKYGGGILCENGSPTIKNCIISNNSSYSGAGIYCRNSNPTIINCRFKYNSAVNGSGGGLYNYDNSNTIVKNCMFFGNSIGGSSGGGIYNNKNSNSTIINCTVVGNSAPWGRGGGMDSYDGSTPSVSNCIFWNNTASFGEPQINRSASVSYSNVQGGISGIGNINSDPLFVEPESHDYHLRIDSPCIETGDPTYVGFLGETDIDGNLRVNGHIDMGADEYYWDLPYLYVTPQSSSFISVEGYNNPADQSITIHNLGNQALNWTVDLSHKPDWLTLITSNGSLELSESKEVIISINISGLYAGQYSYSFEIIDLAALNSPQTITINLKIIGSQIMNGDINRDLKINLSDFSILANQWNGVPSTPSADIAPYPEGDTTVDIDDLLLLTQNWLIEIE